MNMAATKIANEEIKYIPLSDIHVDMKWNVRSAAHVIETANIQGETKSDGIKGLIESLKTIGQDTAIIVRPREMVDGGKSKIKEPYVLVAGFRRFTGLSTAYADAEAVKKATDAGKTVIPGQAHWTAKAVVRNYNDTEARLCNIRENTSRDNLSTPDLMCAVLQLASAPHNLSGVAIAANLDIAQSYAAELLKIAGKLDRSILDHYRNGGMLNGEEVPLHLDAAGRYKPLTLAEMNEVATVDKARQIEQYKILLGKVSGDGANKDKAWMANALKKAEKMGAYLGKLAKSGLFGQKFDIDKFEIDWGRLVEEGALLKLHKSLTKKKQRDRVAVCAAKAFVNEYNKKEEERESDEEEDDDAEAA